MTFIIVDDNATFRNGLKFYIEEVLNHKVIATAETGDEFLSIPNIYEADIVLMDNAMPIINGIDVSKIYLMYHPELKIIMLTQQPELLTLKQLIESGILGCVDKKEIENQLELAIKNVIEGKIFFSDELLIA